MATMVGLPDGAKSRARGTRGKYNEIRIFTRKTIEAVALLRRRGVDPIMCCTICVADRARVVGHARHALRFLKIQLGNKKQENKWVVTPNDPTGGAEDHIHILRSLLLGVPAHTVTSRINV